LPYTANKTAARSSGSRFVGSTLKVNEQNVASSGVACARGNWGGAAETEHELALLGANGVIAETQGWQWLQMRHRQRRQPTPAAKTSGQQQQT